ncbi:hypothetical protein THASP1DRAFT_31148 [Thamnocephalis sphaerospora]|uniref:Uncharacterized protein n=1 Tax=Thamnocephalis sphaerospora TaxID=78915 RepID=A0A4V1IWC1_9FUNG|nr:hypothetical protein THASP1DRAFT_31148 [Thamnocephalis sphaerospora]|eukprot:RKP07039.1 hypothetical protein THASP1DRAFT_31148 [Thamnocephalis sphaerospora]
MSTPAQDTVASGAFSLGHCLRAWQALAAEADAPLAVLEAESDVTGAELAALSRILSKLRSILEDVYKARITIPSANTVAACLEMLENDYQLKETIVRTMECEQPTAAHVATFRALWRVQPYLDETVLGNAVTAMEK